MKPKTRFALKAALVSVPLFAAWPAIAPVRASILSAMLDFTFSVIFTFFRDFLSQRHISTVPEANSYFLIPGLALIIASRASKRRKAVFLGGSFFCFFLFSALALTLTEFGAATSPMARTVIWLQHSLVWAFSIFMVLVFTNGQADRLWLGEPQPEPSNLKRCPICGKAKVGLKAHLLAVHGPKSLKDRRVTSLGGQVLQ